MAAELDRILLCNDGNGLNQFQFKYLNGENIFDFYFFIGYKKKLCGLLAQLVRAPDS